MSIQHTVHSLVVVHRGSQADQGDQGEEGESDVNM